MTGAALRLRPGPRAAMISPGAAPLAAECPDLTPGRPRRSSMIREESRREAAMIGRKRLERPSATHSVGGERGRTCARHSYAGCRPPSR